MAVQLPPKARILDVYASFSRVFGGWTSISALVELMGEFDVEPHSVRSAVARIKRRGLIEADKRDGLAGYRLTQVATEILEDGDQRIFRDPLALPGRSWVVALFSVPESQRNLRYVVRSRLARLGFAQGPAGCWFAPSSVVPETRRMLAREDLTEFVSLWDADYLGSDDIAAVVAEAWDLDAVRSDYDAFIELASPVAAASRASEPAPRQAFVDYLDVMASWRPLPYLDPGLPPSVTPDGWPSPHARELFSEIHERLRPIATQHYVSVAVAPALASREAAAS